MSKSKVNWRFPNLNPDFTHICHEVEQALGKGISWGAKHKAWSDFIETTWEGGTLSNLCYAYGMQHHNLVEMERWNLMFYLQEGERAIAKGDSWMIPLKSFSSSHLSFFGLAVAIADPIYQKKISTLIEKTDRTSDITDSMTIPEHHQLVKRMVGRQWDSETERLARITLSFDDLNFPRQITYLGLRDEVKFNALLQSDIEDFLSPCATRARKRRVLPHEMVFLDFISDIAIALDSGLRFTYYDPALPIWDFPIAQRPEIQKLLTPEMIQRIPDPSVFKSTGGSS